MRMKRVLLGILTVGLMLGLAGCGVQKIKISKGSEDYIGRNYEMVMDELKEGGFTKIIEIAVDDLTSQSDMPDGTIEMIAIDGKSSFAAEEYFDPDAKVELVYHIIPRLAVPVGSDEIQDMKYRDLEELFREAGFTNVETEEKHDLDPDISTAEYVNDVLIAGKENFAKGKEVPYDARIYIVAHLPYAKSTLLVNVNCESNFIFSKYDVNCYLEGELLGTVEHGKRAVFEKKLKPGEYELRFENSSDYTKNGKISVTVDGDVEAMYEIVCHSDQVEVNELAVEHKRQLEDGEAMIPCKEVGFIGRNYKTVETELRQLGFTNIKTERKVGSSGSESVVSVTIGGTSDYGIQEITASDTEVVITYCADK